MRNILIITFLLVYAQLAFSETKNEIVIENSRIKAVPASSQNSAGFMILRNNSNKNIQLVKAESDISDVVELHTMTMIDGMMKMRPVEKIEIKAKGFTELKPGGFHVMFIGLKAPLKENENKNVKLTFSNGQKETISMPVKEIEMMK